MNAKLSPVHPGEYVLEVIDEMGITQYRLAKDIGVPARRINEIVKGKRSITVDTALRLARYLGTTPQYWLNLQSNYDLQIIQPALADDLAHITPHAA